VLRLIGQLAERPVAFTLREGTNVVGSSHDAAIRLGDPSVSRRHAELIAADDSVEIVDLGSRNGTFVDGRAITREHVRAGCQLGFGRVRLALEVVPADDEAIGLALAAPPAPPAPDEAIANTVGTRAIDTFTMDHLPQLLALLGDGADPTRMAAAVGAALVATLPAVSVEVLAIETNGHPAVLYVAHREVSHTPTLTTATAARIEVRLGLPSAEMAGLYTPLVEIAARLVALGGRGDRPRPPESKPVAKPLPPEPASVVPAIQRIYHDAAQVAAGEVGVLIRGESGTGKEVLARFIHAASRRAKQPFIALNCAALPLHLLEAELFGIERGVATGVDARQGKFEQADGGTLFLDEIGDMAPETQAKILRALVEGEVYRVGGTTPKPARVRVIAATHRNMDELLAAGTFREDLYYRIATWVVELPPLRHRRADIPNLAAFFLAREVGKHALAVRGISRAALERIANYAWPGNIRELENEIARAALFLHGRDLLDTAALSPRLLEAPAERPARLKDELLAAERIAILRALRAVDGDVGAAATELGLGRSTLYRRMKELGIAEPESE
jgi:DNA-binding NtrC family response regulator